MIAKVVDASALLAVMFNEPEGPLIEDRLDGAALAAPDLLPYEVANACMVKMRVDPGRSSDWLHAFGNLWTLNIDFHEVTYEAVIELAQVEKLTVYDASYLWLSRKLNAELVTLDQRLGAAIHFGSHTRSP